MSGLCEALLDSVKVTIPDQGTIPLNAVASVTVKQNTLFVEVWDTDVCRFFSFHDRTDGRPRNMSNQRYIKQIYQE
jgi:hypothetical protein